MKKLLNWLITTKAWLWFASKYVSHFNFRAMGYTKFPMDEFFKITTLICAASCKKNTIFTFVSSDYDSLASKLIRFTAGGGLFSHAGIILPSTNLEDFKILHMKGQGPTIWHILQLLKEIDYLVINEIELTPENYDIAMQRIDYIKVNKYRISYDYQQDLGTIDSLYCSEANYLILKGLVSDPDLIPRNILGKLVFDPDSMLKIGKVIYSNHPKIRIDG